MNKTIQSFFLLRRAALTLLVAVMAILTAGATEFITDVMLIGGTDQEVAIKKALLKKEGWKVIDQDLNAGCGKKSDYIYLLYKTADNFTTPNLTFITGFYISNEKNYSDSYYFNRNRYYLVPYDGGDHFKSLKGDLNSNAGGKDIHLYYTKEHLSDQQYYEAATGISFDKTKKGAVGVNGGSKGYDLNEGAGGDYIYMHLDTDVAHRWEIQKSSDNQQCYLKGYWGENENVKSVPAIIEGAVVTGIFVKKFQAFTNLETFYFYEGIDITSMPSVRYCTKFAHVYVVDGNGTKKKFDELPPSITTLPDSVFFLCSSLTSLTIPKSVTSIGKSAFQKCSGLKSFTIPDGVSSIGEYAFFGCSGLTSITIPDGVLSIGEYAFFGCSGLTSITIGSSVTSIGDYSLGGCWRLTSITIPNSVSSIGEYAFKGCSGLTSVTIPNSVSSIGEAAFMNCTKLERVNIADIAAWCEISFFSSDSNPLFYANNLYLNNEKITSLTIPNSVTSIGKYAFSGYSGLTSVTISNSVTNIGEDAFSGCTQLERVNITDIAAWCNISFSSSDSNPLSCAHNLYLNNKKITSLTIPNSVTSIGENAFIRCSGLTSVTIPNSVTSIGKYAFYGCSGLTSVAIPNSVTSIGENAFYQCSSLTSATIGSKVSSMGVGIFAACLKLETISVDPDNTTYDSRKNCNAIIESSSNTLIAGCKSTIIPESVTSIGKEAFFRCFGLPSLTSVTIPNGVTGIGESAFARCYGLTSVTIPNSVTYIGVDAFIECTGMTDVYCFANPSGLTWDEKDCNDFIKNRGTNCHVFNTSDWSGFESKVNVTFVGDLAIDFADNADNSTSISSWKEDGRKVNARLKDRTLYKDGAWNTLCLPFALSNFTGTPLEGATVMTFSDASFAAGTLTLNFAEVTRLSAGEPFIVKWPVGEDIAHPVFKDVCISTQTAAKETDVVTFQGIYAPLKIEGEDNTLLYVGAGDKLYWPNAAMSIGAFRAYFRLNGGLTVGDGSSSATIRRTVLNFGDDATGIASPKSSPEGKDFGSPLLQEGQGEAWCDLYGRRIDGQPAAKGIYISNGKKYIVK